MDKKSQLVNILQAIPWFQRLSDEHFNTMVEISNLIELEQDKVLFKEGEIAGKYIYVVADGRVGIETNFPGRGRCRIFTAEAMDVIGWTSLVSAARYTTASARAVLDSYLVAIDAQKLRQLCEENHHLGYVVMRQLANVIASRLLVTRIQLLDLYAPPSSQENINE
jgi:CRP-like cAMP-binding protein